MQSFMPILKLLFTIIDGFVDTNSVNRIFRQFPQENANFSESFNDIHINGLEKHQFLKNII